MGGSLNDQLKQAIQQLAGTFNKDGVQVIQCTVDSVNEDAFECDVTAIGGVANTEIPSVSLSAEGNDGFNLIPEVGSTVLVTITDRGIAYVSMFSDITKVIAIVNETKLVIEDGKITFNDGDFGGLIKIEDQTTKLNELVAELQTQLGLISTGITGAGGAYTPGTLSQFNKNDYENTKIEHG